MLDTPLELVIVHSDHAFAQALAPLVRRTGFETRIVQTLAQASHAPQGKGFDFLLVGVDQVGALDVQQLKMLMRSVPGLRVVAVLGDDMGSYEDLLRQSGVNMILTREMSVRQIAQFLESQAELRQLELQNFRLRQMLDGRTTYEYLIGASAPMQAMYRLLDQVARTDAPVLISGEEGSERIEVARSIHQKSERRIHPLVVVDCTQGEDDAHGDFLFGPHGRGLHAAGPCARESAFAQAGAGVIVLHRVECLQLEAQKRLLDFLHRPFFQNETPGSPQPLARIIVTTTPNLLGRVEAGEFARELFYRLNILQVRVPTLRERREDIPMLSQHFLRMAAQRSGDAKNSGLCFSSRAMLHLFQYDWPGNMEELKDVVCELVARSAGPQIEVDELEGNLGEAPEVPCELQTEAHSDVPLKDAKRLFESEYFKGLLRRTRGNMTMASRYSRVGRPYLYKKIREYGIEPEQFR